MTAPSGDLGEVLSGVLQEETFHKRTYPLIGSTNRSLPTVSKLFHLFSGARMFVNLSIQLD